MRCVSRFFCVVGLGFLPLFPAEARERLVMPFDCGVEGGEVHLSPAAEKSYRIVGSRDEQTVTTCAKSASASCRTVMVHKFTISCGGARVAWMHIAAAIRSADANRAWIEAGRLNLVMPGRDLPEAAAACLDGARGRRIGPRAARRARRRLSAMAAQGRLRASGAASRLCPRRRTGCAADGRRRGR